MCFSAVSSTNHCFTVTVSVFQVGLIGEGNIVWGGLVIGLTFLPMAVFYAYGAVELIKKKANSRQKQQLLLLFSPLLLALYLLAVAVMTPCLKDEITFFFTNLFH